jgi:hypothetical protein
MIQEAIIIFFCFLSKQYYLVFQESWKEFSGVILQILKHISIRPTRHVVSHCSRNPMRSLNPTVGPKGKPALSSNCCYNHL